MSDALATIFETHLLMSDEKDMPQQRRSTRDRKRASALESGQGCARHTPLQICYAAPTLICARGPLGPPGPHIVHPAPCLVCECFAFPASLLTKSPRSDSRCRRNHSMVGATSG